MPERNRLPRVELDRLLLEAPVTEVRQGQVHVVAAHQDMVADRNTAQHQLALLLGDADQRQVGCAAAHVANQQHVTNVELAPPTIAPISQPGIDRRLRLFQQHYVVR